MAKGNTFIQQLLELIFQNQAIPDIGDSAGLQPSAAAGDLYLSLHSADPGAGGNQTTNEVSYTGYARVGVGRSGGNWPRTGQSISPAATITFGTCTAGTVTATHAAIGTASSGTGKILYSGTITPNIAIGPGITPQLTTASTVTES